MNELVEVVKTLKPRVIMNYYQKIPKIIWQTMKTNEVPIFMKNYIDTWVENNPEYEYRFFDDEDIIRFLKKEYPEFLLGYRKLKYGASKADLWRYLAIYKFGGVYADIDCRCLRSLREWINPNSSFVTQLGINMDLCQWLLISEPGNPIFWKAAKKTLENSLASNYRTSYKGFEYREQELKIRKNNSLIKFNHSILGLSGPPVLQKSAEECLIEGSITNLLPNIQVVCISGNTSCQMNENVAHDTGNEEYRKAYRSLKLNHYNDRSERVKRKMASILNFSYTNLGSDHSSEG